jgi:hypothetical protein
MWNLNEHNCFHPADSAAVRGMKLQKNLSVSTSNVNYLIYENGFR